MTYKEYLEHSKNVKISPNFTQYDVCHSDTALKLGIDNIPSPQIIQTATILCKNILEPIVVYYNKRLNVSCMYRGKDLNKRLKGAVTSQHLLGQACDFTITGINCKKIFNDIISGRICLPVNKKPIPLNQLVDQCIYENTWIHISYSNKVRRKEFLKLENGKYIKITKELL